MRLTVILKDRNMTKYYYDCPLQALYMNKEFGVNVYLEFQIIMEANLSTGETIRPTNQYNYEPLLDFINNGWGFEEVCKIVNEGAKIIVSKESNHIFEPKDWDLKNDQTGEIIMRDGKHFFMPKVIEE